MLEKKITNELKEALKAGEKTKLSVLRMLISEIKNKKIADKIKDTLDDEKVISCVKKMARQHKESIEKFKEGNRQDLVEKEESELKVLEEYLPEEMSFEEIEKVVAEVVQETGASSMKDMGNVMKGVLEKTKGSADGSIVSKIVKEKLG